MGYPSGEQVRLAADGYEAYVVEVGAGLRTLTYDGRDLVAGYAVDAMCSAGRGQLLIPWPNRIEDGRYDFGGSHHQLPLSEPARHNASHGLTRWSGWRLTDRTAASASYRHRVHPQPGYPFELDLQADYTVRSTGLQVTVRATNTGDGPAPYAHGAHPYLTVGRPVDGCALLLPADTVCETDDRGLPGPPASVEGGRFDFRDPRIIADTSLDNPYTGLRRDGRSGRATARLHDPETGRGVELWVDEAYRWLQAFTGDGLGDAARRAVAVEPMTSPPNAFRSGVDLVVLAPGETRSGTWGITAS